MVNKTETPKSKEPERALEDEFKDLHLKLSVLEVLAMLPCTTNTELNPFKDVLVFRKMVEWESEDLIDKKIDWKRPSKEEDGTWHIRIEMIDLDGENFDRIFQSFPTTMKLSEKEKPSDIIDLEHFHDS
ncbi:hypothetical protein Tco_0558812 [Tanacetum coccineum]